MNITKAIKKIKYIIKDFPFLTKVIFYHLYQIFWFIRPQKTIRRAPQTMQRPLAELSGVLFIPGNILALKRLCLQKIDLRSGALQRQIFKGTGHGHSVICAKTGKGWLLPENGFSIIEFNLQTLRQTDIITSDGNLIGGHGTLSPDGNRLYFVDRSINERNPESNLVVYDINLRRVIHKYEGVGIYSHEVKITSDEQRAIVANYGRVTSFLGKTPLVFSEQSMRLCKPSFTIIDLQRQAIKSKYEFNESFLLAHVELDENEHFVFIQGTNFFQSSKCTNETKTSIIRQRKIPLSSEEKLKGIIFTPAIQLKVDLHNGNVVKHVVHNLYRSQSILFLKRTNQICETFGISKRVVLFDKDTLDIKKQFDFSSLNFFDPDPRGLALSADERFLFVSGRQNNIYCLDLCSESKLGSQIIYSDNNTNSHITIFGG